MSLQASSPEWTIGPLAPVPAPVRPVLADSPLTRAVALGLGLALAVTGVFRWFVPADFLCAGFLGALLFSRRLRRVPDTALVFLAAIFLSLIPALMVNAGPATEVWIGFAAMLAGFGCYLAGLNLGGSAPLVRWLLTGLAIGIVAQLIVVAHDALSLAPWFPAADGAVRGTLANPGALAAYGFAAAGLLLTFGATSAGAKARYGFLAAGLLAAIFVLVTPAASGAAALIAWAVLFAAAAWRLRNKRAFHVFVLSAAGLLLFLSVYGARVWGAPFTEAIETRSGALITGVESSVDGADAWFPFGAGLARVGEAPNGLLAVAMEFGVLGFAAYAGMLALPLILLFRRRRTERLRLDRLLLASFLPASVLFMVHTPLLADRTFLLFLGVATAHVLKRRAPVGARAAAAPRIVPGLRPLVPTWKSCSESPA